MTYAVDFDQNYDRGDFRFFLRRTKDGTVASRRPLYSAGKIDLSASEMRIEPEDLPEDLKVSFNILCDGGLPALRQ